MFIRDYLKIFLPLVAMLGVYRLIAVPLIEPTHADVKPIGPASAFQAQLPWWSEHFVEDSWQRKQPKILETPQGIFLFEKWDKLAPDRWKLHPLTIILPQSDDAAAGASGNPARRRVVLIDNPQGAEIQFKEAIDWTSGHPPPVIGGQLNGKITLYSPPNEDGSADTGLRIDAADLRIDRRRIWTTKGITMRIGRSYVEGRDLTILLDQDLLSSKQANSAETDSPFKGLDTLELIYVDRVHIDLPPGGLFGERLASEAIQPNTAPAHAEVRCRGSFRFEFHQSNATLLSKVELRHLVEGMKPDTFESDRLDLHFAWKDAKPSAQHPTATREWTIDRIEAVGTNGSDPNDRTRWVHLEAPSIRSRGLGRWMRVDMARGKIMLANHLPGQASNEPAQVYLERDSMQLWSPVLEYEGERLRPNQVPNTSIASKSLGQLWSAGPGTAKVVAEDGDAWTLSWAKSLEMKPEGELDRLTIDGSANARSDRQGQFSAEIVDIWLRSIPEPLIARVKQQTGGYEPSSVLPERLHAAGTVIIRSPQLRTQVADLQAWFAYPEIELAKQSVADPSVVPLQLADKAATVHQPTQPNVAPKAVVASPLGTAFSNLVVMAEQTSNGSASQPSSSSNIASSSMPGPGRMASTGLDVPQLPAVGQAGRDAPRPLPTNITGETMVAKFSQTSSGMKIEDLAINNNVTVTRDQVSPTSPMPLTIIGNELRMDSAEQGNLDVTIIGMPAKFSIGAGAMESTEIRFNQARKMVWMEQPGIFRLPPEAFQSKGQSADRPSTISPPANNTSAAPGFIGGLRANVGGSQVQWIQQPEVQWQGQMIFDGRTARMDGGVRLTGRVATEVDTVWHLDGRADELKVELEEAIDFTGEAGSRATIANIRLINNVDLKAAQTDMNNNRRSLEHLEVPELNFYVPQQKWLGTGPGSLRTRRIGNANPESPIAVLNGVPNSAPSTQTRHPQAELQCVHLRFGGRMEGDMLAQQVDFHDRVEVLLQPILSWDQTPDVRLVDQLKIGQTMMTCDRLRINNSSNLSWTKSQIADQQLRRDAAWEITCEGHVVVDNVGEKETIKVVTPGGIQYVALHSLMRIYGNGPEPAEVRRQSHQGNSEQDSGVARISNGAFNIKTGESNIEFRSISGDLRKPPPAGQNNVSPAFPMNGNGRNGLPAPRDMNLFPQR